jgi:hypothetical protein
MGKVIRDPTTGATPHNSLTLRQKLHTRNGRVMVSLYAARIEDLGPGDFGLPSGRFLLSLGFPPYTAKTPN